MSSAKKISKESRSSFYYAFSLLPSEKRDAMNTVYAFCRKTDDIVDMENETVENKETKLNEWESELNLAVTKKSKISLLNELNNKVDKFDIPTKPFFDLVDGMKMDLKKNRYSTFNELKEYCYKVASTVGLMTIPIFGYKNKLTIKYAENLGIALQLTNILRDIKTDALVGRIYLPQEDLEKFNYSENDLLENIYNKQFVKLMKFQVERAKFYFSKANNNVTLEDKGSLFAARAMQHIYERLLQKIETENYDVYRRKINVSRRNKIFISLSVWAKYKLVY
ncbi:MAG: presqualene diphosphate synthase HpnD [Ignavibacteriae bacterium]|nr:presqualene diphosphate synthase HpnD [Ignavibacteriota bacterium]